MKIFIIFYLILNIFIYSQEIKEDDFFTIYDISLLGGLNLETSGITKGTLVFECAKNIFSKVDIKIFTGYYKTLSTKNYNVFSYQYVIIENYKKYHTLNYAVKKTYYTILPIGFGFNYYLSTKHLKPYLLCELSYNLIDPLTEKTMSTIQSIYDTYEEIPNKYKNANKLPNDAFGISIGLGCKIPINSNYAFNVRYIFKSDQKIPNTHHILFGLTI